MHFSTTSTPLPDLYRLLTGGVVPRPIAWVSTRSSAGVDNLAPFSFFTVASVQPPVLAVTHVNPPNRPYKDTLANLLQTRECVVNIVTPELLDAMNACSAEYPAEVSEFAACGIAPIASEQVGVSGVRDALVRYECRLRDVLTLSEQAGGGRLVLLDVLGTTVAPQLLHNGQFAPDLLESVGKLGGDMYATAPARSERKRPVWDAK